MILASSRGHDVISGFQKRGKRITFLLKRNTTQPIITSSAKNSVALIMIG